MRFVSGGFMVTAEIQQMEEAPSPQTGNPLRSGVITFRARGDEMHEQALAVAGQQTDERLYSVTDAGEPEAEWKVVESDVTYMGNPPWGVNHHTWRLQQVERLNIQLLRLGSSAVLEPEVYREEVQPGGTLRLVARAFVGQAELSAISALNLSRQTVDVIREGISDTPRQMVVDHYVWGSRYDSPAVVLTCVEPAAPLPFSAEDGVDPRGVAERAGTTQAISAAASLEALVGLLQRKGVLSAAELEQATTAAHEQARARLHASREVADLSAWPV